jgi:hypothetical protein
MQREIWLLLMVGMTLATVACGAERGKPADLGYDLGVGKRAAGATI